MEQRDDCLAMKLISIRKSQLTSIYVVKIVKKIIKELSLLMLPLKNYCFAALTKGLT